MVLLAAVVVAVLVMVRLAGHVRADYEIMAETRGRVTTGMLRHFSDLSKSATQLFIAIHHQRNSNICNCCSLGKCKDNSIEVGCVNAYR